MKSTRAKLTVLCVVLAALTPLVGAQSMFPIEVGTFEQQIHTPYTEAEGLPSNDVLRIAWLGSDVQQLSVRTSGGGGLIMVELWGIEPQASALRTQRSTN